VIATPGKGSTATDHTSAPDGSRAFVAEFDATFYRRTYPDLKEIPDDRLETHYREFGISEGRMGSMACARDGFLRMLDHRRSILEIGPLANPALRGHQVKYFDVLPTDALRKKAAASGLDPDACPHIDFVSENGDLAVISDRFDVVFSSHAIEHQPDLVRHLRGVEQILNPQGQYFVIVPDKRYCFDHFIPESTIADVLDAYLRRVHRHDAASVIEHLALTTHNDSLRHWNGDHGEPACWTSPERIRQAMDMVLANPTTYIDTHAWQFTPESFREIVHTLFGLGLTGLDVVRVYRTTHGSIEFYAVLQKIGVMQDHSLPPLNDFDPVEYLLANPDVALAGVDPAVHYLTHGRAENRRLRR
jgi:SAM-dependent methyltransferase